MDAKSSLRFCNRVLISTAFVLENKALETTKKMKVLQPPSAYKLDNYFKPTHHNEILYDYCDILFPGMETSIFVVSMFSEKISKGNELILSRTLIP